MRALEKERIPK